MGYGFGLAILAAAALAVCEAPVGRSRERAAPVRWSQPRETLPRPDALGRCPGPFEPWRYDPGSPPVCVRRA